MYHEPHEIFTIIVLFLSCEQILVSSLVYLFQHRKSKKFKENLFIVICSVFAFVVAVLCIFLEANSRAREYTNTILRVVTSIIPILNQTSITASKLLFNVIFTFRYEEFHARAQFDARKRTKIFKIIFIAVAIILFCIHVTCVLVSTSEMKEFNYNSIFVKNGLTCNVFVGVLWVIMVLLQFVIMICLTKPLYDHIKRKRNITDNSKIKKQFHKSFLCYLLLFIADVLFMVVYMVGVHQNLLKLPFVNAGYLILNLLVMICSYDDYEDRLLAAKNMNQIINN